MVSCAEAGDQIADEILSSAVEELALSVKAVVQRLHLAGEGVPYFSLHQIHIKQRALILYFRSDAQSLTSMDNMFQLQKS